MARIYFACQLNEFKTNYYRPLIQTVMMAVGQPINMQWATADGKSGRDWAAGVVEATPEQITAINADSRIQAMTATEINAQFQTLSNPRKNRINTFFTARSIALPTPTETIRSALERLIATLDTKTLAQMEALLA
jgi:hypothetical protein